jgi:hypothetical protein
VARQTIATLVALEGFDEDFGRQAPASAAKASCSTQRVTKAAAQLSCNRLGFAAKPRNSAAIIHCTLGPRRACARVLAHLSPKPDLAKALLRAHSRCRKSADKMALNRRMTCRLERPIRACEPHLRCPRANYRSISRTRYVGIDTLPRSMPAPAFRRPPRRLGISPAVRRPPMFVFWLPPVVSAQSGNPQHHRQRVRKPADSSPQRHRNQERALTEHTGTPDARIRRG